jgi:hypothetical protein
MEAGTEVGREVGTQCTKQTKIGVDNLIFKV